MENTPASYLRLIKHDSDQQTDFSERWIINWRTASVSVKWCTDWLNSHTPQPHLSPLKVDRSGSGLSAEAPASWRTPQSHFNIRLFTKCAWAADSIITRDCRKSHITASLCEPTAEEAGRTGGLSAGLQRNEKISEWRGAALLGLLRETHCMNSKSATLQFDHQERRERQRAVVYVLCWLWFN